ncbi:MAG: hypothetical protein PF447_12190 [Spirochaetaceae bacterium]|nr:hypothetical protein [Spirochaetaceae bacterium]
MFSILESSSTGQFSKERVAFLFYPGEYSVDIPIGYYTSVGGLGQSPDDVVITGNVSSDAVLPGGNATCNFWRSVENFSVIPTVDERMKWAVAQATPFRRMHIRGNLHLADSGATPWSSGGLIANSKVDGAVSSLSQQQWLTRNSQLGRWRGGAWNMAFLGVEGAPVQASWNSQKPVAVKETTPKIAERPFLNVDDAGWNVFVPALKSQSSSYNWDVSAASGKRISLEDFYIAKADIDTAATINQALSNGKHILFTPGIYSLEDTVEVDNAETVILGLGYATLIPQGAFPALSIDDVEGVRVAGIMVDAGTEKAPTLVEAGRGVSQSDNSENPIILHDMIIRVGNGTPGTAEAALTVNANHVIGDHLWLWVADHDGQTFPLPWTTNASSSGIIVRGDGVSMYGLFCEHFQEFQTLWEGNEGSVYMYQSELPYYADTEEWWSTPEVQGYASYKVADDVSTHYAWAIGIYMVFGETCQRAVEVPEKPGVQIERAMITSIASGTLNHIVNDAGSSATAFGTAYLEYYPEQ